MSAPKSFNNVYELLKRISDSHYQLKTFVFGDPTTIEGIDRVQYPAMIAVPISSQINENTIVHTFRIAVADIVNKDESNKNEVWSDTQLILGDIVKVLRYEDFSYLLTNQPTLSPFYEKWGDEVSGWAADFIIEFDFDSSECNIPIEDFLTPGPTYEGAVQNCFELERLCDVIITNATTGQVLTFDGNHWVNADASGGAESLDELTDVEITTPVNGEVLTYQDGTWVNQSIPDVPEALDDLTDVTITTPLNGQGLVYIDGTWTNQDLTMYGKELLSGGIIWSGTGFVYDVGILTYTFYLPPVTTGPTQVTLNDGDPDDDRIDAVVIDESGNVLVIEGVPSPNPATPDVSEYVLVQYIIVPANATEPVEDVENIYLENTEWVTSIFNVGTATGTINFVGTNSPQSGSVCIEANTNQNRRARFTSNTGLHTANEFQLLSLYVRLPVAVPTTKAMSVWLYLGSTVRGTVVNLFSYGLNRNLPGVWQLVIIPMAVFNAAALTFDNIVMALTGNPNTNHRWDLDNIKLTSGVIAPPAEDVNVNVQQDGNAIGQRPTINFVESTGINLSVTDSSLNNRVDVNIAIDTTYLNTRLDDYVLVAGDTMTGSLTLPKLIVGADLGAQINVATSGQFGNQLAFRDLNPGSYIGFDITTDQGLASQILTTGSTFANNAFKSSRTAIANYFDGVSLVAGSPTAQLEFYTGGFGLPDLRFKIDENGNSLFLDNTVVNTFNNGLVSDTSFAVVNNRTNALSVYNGTYQLMVNVKSDGNTSIGINATDQAKLGIRSDVSDNSQYALYVQNFAGSELFKVLSDGLVSIGDGAAASGLYINTDSAASYTGDKIFLEVGGGTWNYGFNSSLNSFTTVTTGSSTGGWLFGTGTSASPTAKLYYDGTASFFGINTDVSGNAVLHARSVAGHSSTTDIILAETDSSEPVLRAQKNGIVSVGKRLDIKRSNYGAISAFTIEADGSENTLMSTINADLIFQTKSSGTVETARFTNTGIFKMADDTRIALGAYDTVALADMYGYISSAGNTSSTVGLKFEVTQIGGTSGETALTIDAGGHAYFGLNNVYASAITLSILQDATYGLYINNDNSGAGGLIFSGKTDVNAIYSNQAVPFHLYMNITEAISMVGSNVGIYNNNPQERLDVVGGNIKLTNTINLFNGLYLANLDTGNAAASGIRLTSASGDNGYIYLTGPNYAAADPDTLIVQNTAGDIQFFASSAFPVVEIKQTLVEVQQEISINHNFRTAYSAISTTQALGNGYTFDCTGTITVTLPDAATSPGRIMVIKNSGVGVITIDTTSSQTIDGLTSQQLTSQWDSYTVQSTGADWIII